MTSDRQLEVSAAYSRQCRTRTTETVEVTKERTADLRMVSPDGADDGYVVIAATVLAPVVALGSGLVTAITLAVDGKSSTRHEIPSATIISQCPVAAADLHLRLAFPSGVVVDGVTNARGVALFQTPTSEPSEGVVIVHAPPARAKSFRYGMQPGRLTREEIGATVESLSAGFQSCGRTAQFSGTRRFRIVVEGGRAYLHPTSLKRDALSRCVAAVLREAVFRSTARLELDHFIDFVDSPVEK